MEEYRPLLIPIRSQNLQKTAHSRAEKKKKIFDRTRKLNVPSTVMSIAFCYPDPPQVLLLELLQFSKGSFTIL